VAGAHELAFQAIGGYTVEIVYDQDRLFIVQENLGEIILTSAFRRYVSQRGFKTYFCRKADPESKGKVENVVKYVKQNFLYNRTFKDLETLNLEAQAWLMRTANQLEHGTTKKIPVEEYQIEKEFLTAWYPIIPAELEFPAYAVHKDNKISFKSNVYSLPLGTYKGKGSRVLLKLDSGQLILMDMVEKEICRHDLCHGKGQKVLSRDHVRDKNGAIEQMMDEFSELMENKLLALSWVRQIRDDKPRYIRDQLQYLKDTVAGLDTHTATEALNYVSQHQIVSAADFKAVAEAIVRKNTKQILEDPKIIQLNPLSGQQRLSPDLAPEQSSAMTYDIYFTTN